MRIVMFYHSLISCWNHGHAHFLRGIASELLARGHQLRIFEPMDCWSLMQLLEEQGVAPIRAFCRIYPNLHSIRYDLPQLDLDQALADADLVLAHEWNHPDLIGRLGAHRRGHSHYRLLFHDTHHRSVTNRQALANCDLNHFDGVLAYGAAVRERYLEEGWARTVWTWHEAADTRVFRPLPGYERRWDVVWIGNWGEEERSAELEEFIVEPVRSLGLKACFYGVGYPSWARQALERAGIEYRGYLPNFQVPEAFAQARVTIHVPRRPYVQALPGIPTIRPFEAMACGIPLICSPWQDTEKLFTAGKDYLLVGDGREMREQLHLLLSRPPLRERLIQHARATILDRHTCQHRVDQLLSICSELGILS